MASVEDLERVYVVPQNRNFVWPTIEVGRKVTVPHVKTPLGELLTVPLVLERSCSLSKLLHFQHLRLFLPRKREDCLSSSVADVT